MENLKELRQLRQDAEVRADELLQEGKVEEGKNELEQIKDLDARIQAVEEEIKKIKEEGNKEEDKKEDKPVVEKEDDVRSNTNTEGETRMSNQFKPEIKEQESAEYRGFMEFVRSKGEKRDNVTSVGAEAVIPDDIVTQPVKLPETVTDLKAYANVIKVPSGQGSYPIIESATTKMISVAELEKNPELAKPTFVKVNYDVETFRGQIPISEEALQDSTPDLAALVAENNARIALNTTNDEIGKILKSFAPKAVDGTDGIKDILNVDIDPAYNVMVVASQSFFNALDKLKDNQGQYILQNDITSPSGKSLFGRKVEVVSDTLLGAAGEAKAFIGDVSQAVLFADRAQASIKFQQHDIYGTILMIAARFDVVQANAKAGYFVTYTAPVEGA